MKFNIQDLIDVKQFQALQDRLNTICSFPSAIVDNDGNILTATAWQDICTKFHRLHPECEQECIKSDQYILSHLAEANPAVTYRCPHGLVDNAMPIVIDGVHVANFFTGQFFLERPDLDFFTAQAKQYGFDERAYLDAVRAVPIWNRDQLASYLGFIKELITVIAVAGLENLRSFEARQRVEESENQFRAMFELASIGMAQADPGTGRWLRVNQKMCDITGYSAADMLELRVSEVTHPDDRQADWDAFQRVVRGEQPSYRLEKRYIRKDGSVVWVSVNMTVIRDVDGQPVRTMATIEDISERRVNDESRLKSEEALRESERVQRTILQTAMDGFWISDTQGRLLDVSETYCRMSGYSAEELLAMHISDVEVVETSSETASHMRRLVERGEDRFETRHRRKDGTIFDVEVSVQYRPTQGGRLVVFLRDITARKRTEDALRQSEERLRLALSGADLGTWDWQVPTGAVTFNERWAAMLGYTLDEIEPHVRTWEQIVHPDDMSHVMDALNAHLAGRTDAYESEHRVQHKSGHWVWVLDKGRVLERDASGKALRICGTHLDVSERQRADKERTKLEAQLHHAHKMESVGRLAGGVAHDFNNMLGVILGHADLALATTDPAQPVFTDLQEIRLAAERSANLTRQLLAFARKQTIAPAVLDLNETVEAMLKMLRRLIGEDIQLVWRPCADVWPVKMDPSQLDQILVNLCVNARDAIAGVGKVTIETNDVVFDSAFCADHPEYVPGEFVQLAVSDDGCGMSRETLEKLFEPFFTTKEVGKGTGLGLATVYGIVKQNNGFIGVHSEPSRGTVFSVHLPRFAAEAGRSHAGPLAVAPSGREVILLVEDEPAILRMTTTMLERLGYTVLAASGPEEATRLAREYGGEIHLLMTDVVMPEMNGRDLSTRLLSVHPRLKCLFTSGYTADVIGHHGVLSDGIHFIQKPFSVRALATKIRLALEDA